MPYLYVSNAVFVRTAFGVSGTLRTVSVGLSRRVDVAREDYELVFLFNRNGVVHWIPKLGYGGVLVTRLSNADPFQFVGGNARNIAHLLVASLPPHQVEGNKQQHAKLNQSEE